LTESVSKEAVSKCRVAASANDRRVRANLRSRNDGFVVADIGEVYYINLYINIFKIN
jgi:hypothetical protein